MRFDLVDLRLFDAVVRAGSISGGAGAMHMALASASARITGMEATLGVPLFERQRRGVVPTAAGRSVLHHARMILAQVERMRGDLRSFATGLKGEIRMLSNTAGLVELVPAALRVFLAANPDVDIDLEEATSAEILAAVASGRADLGLVAATGPAHGVELRSLAVDRLMVIAGRTSALAGRSEIDFASLLAEPFVGLRDGALHDHLAAHAMRLGRRLAYRVRLRSFDAVARLVAAGIGVGVLPLAAVERHRNEDLVVLRLTDAWAERRLALVARAFDTLPAHTRMLVDAIEHASPREAAALDA